MTGDRPYEVWLSACLKGGVGKTKTTMFVAQDLADRGYEVMIGDADPGTQGVVGWVSTLTRDYPSYDLPWHVKQWARTEDLLVQWVDRHARATGARYVVLDIGAEIPDVLTFAAMLADQVIVPCGTQQDELDRIAATFTSLQGGLRPGVVPRVLLTRVDQLGAGAARKVRKALVGGGYSVFATEVSRNRGLYDRFGLPMKDGTGEYHDLVDELLGGQG
jgi:cellulose biosynthesis protein BcsQ